MNELETLKKRLAQAEKLLEETKVCLVIDLRARSPEDKQRTEPLREKAVLIEFFLKGGELP